MATMEEKVPGGKLVRVTVDPEKVTLSGDFFIHPEEGVFLIEQALLGLKGHEDPRSVEAVLLRLTADHHIELIGLNEQVIARLYAGASNGAGASHVAGPGA